MVEKQIRRCVLGCGRILDDHAPSNTAPGMRTTLAHCPSPQCNWCQPCMRRRHFEIQARERDAADIPPDQMT